MAQPKPPGQQQKPPGKSSKVITLTVIGVVSLMVVGFCSAVQEDEVAADCVNMEEQLPDGSYEVVDDDYCDDDNGTTTYYRGSHGAYHWYYGGNRVGTRVRSGTTFRPSDVEINSRSGKTIQRGGFGSKSSSGS
ncbi:hypothetical protein ACWGH8_39695 [Nonomuraea muscovyensis]|uniref:Uncharacterized protein n=1 Tax=Nonomuraea muscovyensis TaxID=1124761 RepID=A0A7X0C6J2_9ACTN|nr:hypothetical protein [Nonomuraea muscovyensis]MBB6349468.1 hypothetical protein [Nonomuraea muscovyensis]MDF2710384.1 hypothetical protein [Nonomuraea muscovyensis]